MFFVKDISKKNKITFNLKINKYLIIFHYLFFSYIFLIFLNKNLVSTKYGLKKQYL